MSAALSSYSFKQYKTMIFKKKPIKKRKTIPIKKASKKRVNGVSKKLLSNDKNKKTVCVFGKLDGKRVSFDDETDSFMYPVFGKQIRPGYNEVEEIKYSSTDFTAGGKIFRVFHPMGKTKSEVFQRLMSGYMGAKQKKELIKMKVDPTEIEKRL